MSSTTRTIKSRNLFLQFPPQDPNTRIPTIIFFITGNPGLISYYHEFLSLLCQQQSPNSTDISDVTPTSTSNPTPESCVIAGFSLGGFDLPTPQTTAATTEDTTTPKANEAGKIDTWTDHELEDLLYPPGFQKKPIYGLQDQIELCYARLAALVAMVKQWYSRSPHGAKPADGAVNVILIGHSVGTYIALEMVRHHHTAQGSPSSTTTPSVSTFRITTTLLLTPTILDISHSPSGRLATPLLSTIPFLPGLAQSSTWALTALLPASRLRWLVGKVTGMRAGSDALEATVAFLMCPGAVRQALWLAGQEMRDIGGNKWGEEVWGVLGGDGDWDGDGDGDGDVRLSGNGGSGWKAPKLCFWFARGDHWVADATRVDIEGFVGRWRGEESARPEVVVDKDRGLVHAWCIEQSEMVAVRVRSWVRDALSRSMKE